MKINILNLVEIRIPSRRDPILPDGDIYVDKGEGGKFRWFIYHGDEYQGHGSARGYASEREAWRAAKRLMRGYRFRRGASKP